jgi:hypothetical protein
MGPEDISTCSGGEISTLESPSHRAFFPTYMNATFLASLYGVDF